MMKAIPVADDKARVYNPVREYLEAVVGIV